MKAKLCTYAHAYDTIRKELLDVNKIYIECTASHGIQIISKNKECS